MTKEPKKQLSKKEIRRKQKKRKKIILITEGVVLVLLLAALFVWQKIGMISFEDLDAEVNDLNEDTAEMMEEYTTIAVFGVDNRSNGNYESGNSDSIMVVNINNKTKEVKVVSVYRDTCMEVDGEGKLRKCNYAYNHGGIEQSVNMLNRNLDLEIDGYVAVDFYALADAIDALGGVEIELTSQEARIMNDSYIDLTASIIGKKSRYVSAGLQTLDGVQAVSYCRVRYTSGGDFKRTERQRTVLMKMVEKVQSASLSQLNDLINAVFPKVSTSFTLKEILSMASGVADYQLTGTCGYPFTKYSGNYGSKGNMIIPCTVESNVRILHAYLFETEEYTPSATLTSLSQTIVDFSGKDEDDAVDYGY